MATWPLAGTWPRGSLYNKLLIKTLTLELNSLLCRCQPLSAETHPVHQVASQGCCFTMAWGRSGIIIDGSWPIEFQHIKSQIYRVPTNAWIWTKISAKSQNERLLQFFFWSNWTKTWPSLFFWGGGKSFTHLPSQAPYFSTFNPGNTSCTAPKVVQPWNFWLSGTQDLRQM